MMRGSRFQPIRNDAPVRIRDIRRVVASPGPWVIAVAFGAYSLVYLSSMAFLPTFLIEREGMAPGTAALLIGVTIFISSALQ